MTANRRAVSFTPMETRRDVIVAAAIAAEELGYEALILPEGWGFDATVLLAELAVRTTRLRLAAGIVSIWGRTAATIAMAAATLEQVSNGRFVLGLGTSTPLLAEGFHDVTFEAPAARLQTTIRRVRRLLAGERAEITPSRTARPLRLTVPAAPNVPIWVGALGPRTTQIAAQDADGWFPAYATLDHLSKVRRRLDEVRRAAGRLDGPLTIIAGPTIGLDGDGSAAATLAFYLSAMGDGYADFVTSQGFGAEVAAVRAANPSPSPLRAVVPPEAAVLLDQLTVTGDDAAVRRGLARWDEVVDVLTVGIPPGDAWDAIERRLEVCAPPAVGPSTSPRPQEERR